MNTLLLSMLIAGTGVTLDKAPTAADGGIVKIQMTVPDAGLPDRRGELMLQIEVLTNSFVEELKVPHKVKSVLWAQKASKNPGTVRDAVLVVWEYGVPGKTRTMGLLFMYANDRWQVFPDTFESL